MNERDVLDILRESLTIALIVGAPSMLTALLVGVSVSLFQALTQLQESTIAFVPKIVAVFLSLMIFMPFMLQTLTEFTTRLADRIVTMQ
jgi:flagellar biosynthetic protein FliQ